MSADKTQKLLTELRGCLREEGEQPELTRFETGFFNLWVGSDHLAIRFEIEKFVEDVNAKMNGWMDSSAQEKWAVGFEQSGFNGGVLYVFRPDEQTARKSLGYATDRLMVEMTKLQKAISETIPGWKKAGAKVRRSVKQVK